MIVNLKKKPIYFQSEFVQLGIFKLGFGEEFLR